MSARLPVLRIASLTGAALDAALPDLARLRIEVFRDWPYLYEGSLDSEAAYLRRYRDAPRAILVAAYDGGRVAGAATGMPLEDHGDAAQIGGDLGVPREAVFYCAESVLLAPYRGRGVGHAFFDRREAQARALGRTHAAFCAVIRPADHPGRPADARSLEAFWRARGYAPVPGAEAVFNWTDRGQPSETPHRLAVWMRAL